MRKLVALFIALVSMTYIAGCGGSSSTSKVTDYRLPDAQTSYPSLLAGSVQSTLGLTLVKPAEVVEFSGSTAGFSNHSTALSPAAKFNRPIAVTTDGTSLYVADSYNNVIRRINIATKTDTTIAGNISGLAGSADGTGTAAFFNRPNGITTDGTNLYVTDSGNFTVRQIVISSGVVTTLAGGAGLTGSVDTIGTAARFNFLNGITTDGPNLYVTDSDNTIRWINIASGKVSTLAGAPGASGADDGGPTKARFNQPARLTTDGPNLYVTDFANRTIRQIVLATGVVTTIAGKSVTGSPGSIVDASDGATARFKQPSGITCDGPHLYVTDAYDNVVRKIVLAPGSPFSGPVSSLANNGAANVNTTIGITTDGVSLFLTDFSTDLPTGNLFHRIRAIQ
jgi:hypothetical protein